MEKQHKPLVVIASHKTLIPNLDQMIENRIKQVGGPRKMEHLLIRKQIIAKRIFHEKFAPSQWFDGQYESELARLRQQLQQTR